MNRTLLLLIAVAVLGAGAYFFLNTDQEAASTTVAGWDRDFAVPRDQVHKVFIVQRSGVTSTLTRKGEQWFFNEKYPARPDAIENLLSAIESIRMKFKPTEAAIPHIVESLAARGIKVEIYGKEDELLKTYYVGGATNTEEGTYVIREGAEQPYVAELGAWVGNLRFRYNLVGDEWRDRTVFASRVEDIASVSIEYPKQQDLSFRLDPTSSELVIPYYPLSPKQTRPAVPGKVEGYLNNFASVSAARFNNLNRERDSISQQVPFAVINLARKDGEQQSMKLFPLYGKPFLDPKTNQTIQPTKVTAYYGLTQDNDFVIMKEEVLGKVLWAYEYFF